MGYGSSSRGNATVLWVTLHTAEGARSARALANFFNGNPNASSHAGCDASEILYMVPRTRAAWTLGPGNPYSVNLEMCAFARWTRAQWLSTSTVDGCPNPRRIVRQAATWARRECDHFGIPYERIGARAVSGWRESVIHHDDYTKGSGWGSHWDVGTGFPWDVFLAEVRGQDVPADAGATSPVWSLPAGHYYGPIDGPAQSHGGYYPAERPIVRMIQQRFQELGHAPSYAGWADGRWEDPTTEACREWERATGRTVDGRIDEDDWHALFGDDDMDEKQAKQLADIHRTLVNSVDNPYNEKDPIYASTALSWVVKWLHTFLIESVNNPSGDESNTTVYGVTALNWITKWTYRMQAEQAGMKAAIEKLAEAQGLDVVAVKAAAEQGVTDALERFELELDVTEDAS